MRCPYCSSENTQVKDSRPTEEGSAIRRRRVCDVCKARFTTFERVQLRDLVVIKRSGTRVPFERDKLKRSIELALRKRPVQPDQIERVVSSIVRQLESLGQEDITSADVGRYVMEHLAKLDAVAYVRFASVYHDFNEASDFKDVIEEIAQAAKDVPANDAGTDDDDDHDAPPVARAVSPVTKR
ncbi:MAG: Transcriptional repressor NrdR [Pseudomonadota bacterium]|jgi:transcriptional repressor NrdR